MDHDVVYILGIVVTQPDALGGPTWDPTALGPVALLAHIGRGASGAARLSGLAIGLGSMIRSELAGVITVSVWGL